MIRNIRYYLFASISMLLLQGCNTEFTGAKTPEELAERFIELYRNGDKEGIQELWATREQLELYYFSEDKSIEAQDKSVSQTLEKQEQTIQRNFDKLGTLSPGTEVLEITSHFTEAKFNRGFAIKLKDGETGEERSVPLSAAINIRGRWFFH